ncbi:hypothetical protein MGYG_05730 [Nannizzia gypsea CBS 118893]|uniref:Uncharacterized protein n=1 Tax=Arthroderma gypseum (strain ATCC MYA-4604 / CBS 118893) TaxID=535722 RepID=E4UXJ7_ARTGP|nr:hypothetical protein MGYG_05730 [Nannizzia gypsea CBS 118893]EFR02731.1 hypothetical protein MGYG_05730 [Nannizzia gypsea CBS 118893]
MSNIKMNQPLLGIGVNPSGRRIRLSQWRSKVLEERSFNIYPTSKLWFSFNHVLDRSYLCGFRSELNMFGYKGELVIAISPKQLSGLRLVSDSEGFIALQVKNTFWEEHWHGSTLDSDDLVFAQIEWPVGYTVRIVASFDAFKIHEVSIDHSASLPQHQSMSWKSRLPPNDLIPVVLTGGVSVNDINDAVEG